MKRLGIFIFLTAIGQLVLAQEAKYDIIRYTPPVGANQEILEELVSHTIVNDAKGTWCQFALYKSVESKGNVEADFASEWDILVVKSNELTSGPKKDVVKEKDGWKILTGSATANFSGTEMIIRHTVLSGYDRCLSIICRTNNPEAYTTTIEQFMNSVTLQKPDRSTTPPVFKNLDTRINGTWIKSSSVHTTWADAASIGQNGYTKDQYNLNADGTYQFFSKTFQASFQKIIFVKEKGTYTVEGNKLTIIPQTSVIESWSKKDGTDKWGKKLSSENRKLEKVTYTFTNHYFEGIQETNLVLQADKPTEREGPFSGNTTFQNAYYYAPVSNHNEPIAVPEN